MNRIPIVFITDDDFVIPTAVAITSLIRNKSSDSYYDIYIIMDEISEDNKKKFLSFNNDSTKIHLILANSKKYKTFHTFHKDTLCVATLSALLKFEIPNLIPEEEKILYLDGDILVNKDLNELYSIDIENKFAAVASDSGEIYFNHISAHNHKYFNSGVMLLNLKFMRENNTSELLLKTKKESDDMNLMDQNVFNTVFKNNVVFLDIKFNFLILNLIRAKQYYDISQLNDLFNSNYKDLKDIEKNSFIVHFSSNDKPWKYKNGICSKKWFNYFKKSPFKNETIERCDLPKTHKLFHSNWKNNLNDNLKNRLNSELMYILFKEKGNPKKIYDKIKAYKTIKKEKLFDSTYYLSKYPQIKEENITPLNHYIYHGYKEQKVPSKQFNGNYYLRKYPDITKNKINPLIHYVLYGKKENRYKNKREENSSSEKVYYTLKRQEKQIKKLKNRTEKLRIIKKQNKQINRLKEQNLEKNKIIDNLKNEVSEQKNGLITQEKKFNELADKLQDYIKIHEMDFIDKERIGSEIENFKKIGIKKEKRKQKLIVSLTSYPVRIHDIHYSIYSLLKQSCKPDEIILWLSEEEFPQFEEDVPKKVINLKKNGLTIKFCKNLKSYKKLIYALKEFPEDVVVTADDDIFYPENWLNELYCEYKNDISNSEDNKTNKADKTDETNKTNKYNKNSEYNKNIICHRAHLVGFDNGSMKPYYSWEKLVQIKDPSFFNFATGCGGILYPPHSLYKDVISEKLFNKLAPTSDDIWFWAMAVLNNTKIKIIQDGYTVMNYINPVRELNNGNEKTLYYENIRGGNDKQMENILNYYPELKDKLINCSYPKISVIIPVYNAEKYLEKNINSIISQTLKDIEIIYINDGSTDDSLKILEKYAKKDERITIINQKNQGAPIAKNKGLKTAKGEYIGFIDADDWIDLNYFETLYTQAKLQNADIARTTYKYNYPEGEFEEKYLNNIIKDKYSKKMDLEINDHSVVICNAIYRRKYLKENKIDHYDNIIVEDVPFTARATFCSNKSIPVIGTFYHYRKGSNNQLTTMNKNRIFSIIKANEIGIEFINSLNYEDLVDSSNSQDSLDSLNSLNSKNLVNSFDSSNSQDSLNSKNLVNSLYSLDSKDSKKSINYTKKDYLKAFKRFVWRNDYAFKKGLITDDFNEEDLKKIFNESIGQYKKCKFHKDLVKDYNEEYFEYLDNNLFEEYLNLKTEEVNNI